MMTHGWGQLMAFHKKPHLKQVNTQVSIDVFTLSYLSYSA